MRKLGIWFIKVLSADFFVFASRSRDETLLWLIAKYHLHGRNVTGDAERKSVVDFSVLDF